MTSKYIGVIQGTISGMVYAVINPDDDSELDNPRWLLMTALGRSDREPVMLMRVPRNEYMGALSLDDVKKLCDKYKASP